MKTEMRTLDRPTGKLGRMPFALERFRQRKANRFTVSLRIPAVPANKVLLRKLRAAEMSDWERASSTAPSFESQAPRVIASCRIVASLEEENLYKRAEGVLHIFLVAATASALWLSFVTASNLPSHWSNFVAFVTRVLQ